MADSNDSGEKLELFGVECNIESEEEGFIQENNNRCVKQRNGDPKLGILNGSHYHSESSLTSTCTESDDNAETCVKCKFSSDENSLENLPLAKRPLLTGKEYHFFVSLSSKDEELVKPIVRALEMEGLKCMFAERDFTAGRLILENIQEKVQRSMKMLLMMTEHFAESGFCKHEHLVAKHVALLENRHHCIIPIMLRPCEVPEELKMLTYIDAEKEVDIIRKIIDAYDVEDRMDCVIPTKLNLVYTTVPVRAFSDAQPNYKKRFDCISMIRKTSLAHGRRTWVTRGICLFRATAKVIYGREKLIKKEKPDMFDEESRRNGYTVASAVATSIRKDNLGAGLEFHELKETEKQKLSDADLQDANKVYEEIRMILNSLWFIKIQRLLVAGKLCTWTFVCLILAVSVSFIFLYGIIFISLRRSDYFSLYTLLYGLLTTVVVCGAFAFAWALIGRKGFTSDQQLRSCTDDKSQDRRSYVDKKSKERRNLSQEKILSIIWDQGKKSFLQQKYFIILNQRNPLRLDFKRYDAGPCRDYIEGKLRSYFPRSTQDEIERKAEDVLERCIVKNLFSQENPFSKLPKASQQRHSTPTFSNLCCLCQLIVLPDASTCSADAVPLTV